MPPQEAAFSTSDTSSDALNSTPDGIQHVLDAILQIMANGDHLQQEEDVAQETEQVSQQGQDDVEENDDFPFGQLPELNNNEVNNNEHYQQELQVVPDVALEQDENLVAIGEQQQLEEDQVVPPAPFDQAQLVEELEEVLYSLDITDD